MIAFLPNTKMTALHILDFSEEAATSSHERILLGIRYSNNGWIKIGMEDVERGLGRFLLRESIHIGGLMSRVCLLLVVSDEAIRAMDGTQDAA